MDVEEHHCAPDDLDGVADEHDPAFRHRVGEGTDEGRQCDIGDGKKSFQKRFVGRRSVHLTQGGDGNDQQSVVGKRGKKLP